MEQWRKRQIEAARGLRKADLVLKQVSYLNVFARAFETGDVAVTDGRIVGLGEYAGEVEQDCTGRYLVPGFIDGHMHLESALVRPQEYARIVAAHGTTAIVADPHEIVNVCGEEGFRFMLRETENLPVSVYLMLPSCVPASPFDENGGRFSKEEIAKYLKEKRVIGLAEVMDYPGVLAAQETVLDKLELVEQAGGKIDGHAPGLTGKDLNAYNTAGIYTDHECTNMQEALEKMRNGEWIMIREGTASQNLDALMGMFAEPYSHRALLVTDDKHPGELMNEGHIDAILRKAIAAGADPETAFTMASYNAALCFGLQRRGAICPGYEADFVLLDDRKNVSIAEVYRAGKPVSDKKQQKDQEQAEMAQRNVAQAVRHTVHIQPATEALFQMKEGKSRIIGLIPGELVTTDAGSTDAIDLEKDIVEVAVLERHHATGHVGKAFLKGYGLQKGAVATTIAHDSHNMILAGTNAADMAAAANYLAEMEGGIVIVADGQILGSLPCPLAGLMTLLDGEETQKRLDHLKQIARELGVKEGIDPFMTLSFMSLPVIPHLKLTTKGLVDVDHFQLLPQGGTGEK